MMLKAKLAVVEGDITRQQVEAIVNAANSSLLGGGGVDGAIHRAAGPGLVAECRQLNGCPTGQARITGGYDLAARWVIHTVGPIWRGGDQDEDQLLAQCYQNSLALADANQIKTIAFPSISTGAYNFPMARAAKIALTEIAGHLETGSQIEKVILVCFGQRAFTIHQAALSEVLDAE
jgi:O-acetyl-ADP-ribose deacetylase (regulator of RNase III)